MYIVMLNRQRMLLNKTTLLNKHNWEKEVAYLGHFTKLSPEIWLFFQRNYYKIDGTIAREEIKGYIIR